MKELTRQIAHFGGGFRIQIAGDPKKVERELNRLFNAGVLTSFDDSYRPGEDGIVNAKSYPVRFNSGIATLASIQVRGAAGKHGISGRGNLRKMLTAAERAIRAQFERVENIYIDKNTAFGQGEIVPDDSAFGG